MHAKIWPLMSETACGYEELIKSKQLEGTMHAALTWSQLAQSHSINGEVSLKVPISVYKIFLSFNQSPPLLFSPPQHYSLWCSSKKTRVLWLGKHRIKFQSKYLILTFICVLFCHFHFWPLFLSPLSPEKFCLETDLKPHSFCSLFPGCPNPHKYITLSSLWLLNHFSIHLWAIPVAEKQTATLTPNPVGWRRQHGQTPPKETSIWVANKYFLR